MTHQDSLAKKMSLWIKRTAVLVAVLATSWPCQAQVAKASAKDESPFAEVEKKYPGLIDELGRLFGKFVNDVKYPDPRGESKILPLLPAKTLAYVAIPNYGSAVHQTVEVFRQELKDSEVLRNWWEHGDMAKDGPEILKVLEEIAELHQFLGDEIALSVSMEGKEPSFLVVARIQKPGLRNYAQGLLEKAEKKSESEFHLMSPQELVVARDGGSSKIARVLVRDDYVAVASELAALKSFNSQLDKGSEEFASGAFGKRVKKEYDGGATIIGAADLQKVLKQIPRKPDEAAMLEKSGFGEVKYLVWGNKHTGDQGFSQMELSFAGPRHGAAAWLANSRPLKSLDFVSPKAVFAGTIVFSDPAQIFDDIREMARNSEKEPFPAVAQMEQMLNLSLKDDLLGTLSGEITIEVDSFEPPMPEWRVIFNLKDGDRLQKTLTTLLTMAPFEKSQSVEGGVTYHTLRIPNGKATVEIGYAIVDGNLIFGSSTEKVSEAVGLHASGGSLGKSEQFLSALPPGHAVEASILFYQDPVAMMGITLRQLPPEQAKYFAKFLGKGKPTVMCVYGDETSIRSASKTNGFDAATVMVVAAIAIPNLLRSRMAANEASAIGSLRMVNTAQVTYSVTYPPRGFAPDLATLGIDPHKTGPGSAEHAGLIDNSLANENCTVNGWCTKSGYRFRVIAVCRLKECKEYAAIAAPVNSSTGARNFCTTSDGVIRYKLGTPLTSPVNVAECREWAPLK